MDNVPIGMILPSARSDSPAGEFRRVELISSQTIYPIDQLERGLPVHEDCYSALFHVLNQERSY
jgi:hypothetical protein